MDGFVTTQLLYDAAKLGVDEDALRILAVVRAAMPAAVRMDLHMLLLLGARERTEAEFRALLDRAGFATATATPTASPAALGVIATR